MDVCHSFLRKKRRCHWRIIITDARAFVRWHTRYLFSVRVHANPRGANIGGKGGMGVMESRGTVVNCARACGVSLNRRWQL